MAGAPSIKLRMRAAQASVAVRPHRFAELHASPITATCAIPRQAIPIINGLIHGIAVIDAHDAWAVGEMPHDNREATLVEHWNGTTWTHIPSPNASQGPNVLFAVTALAATDVWAVGYTNIPGSHAIA